MILNQFKGYNSCTTEASLTKLDMHQHVIVIYIYIKFYEILFNSYLVMAKDGRKDERTEEGTDGHGENNIPPLSARDKRVNR